jgi:hypothetical protein
MNRRFSPIAGACALSLALAAPAYAHHPGGASNTGAAGPIITISAETLEQGHSAIAFLYEYIRFTGLSDAALIAAAGQHQHVHSIGSIASPAVSAAFGVTNDFMLSVRVPYVRRTDIREGHHEHLGGVAFNTVDDRGGSGGIGDATVLGQYRFFNNTATATQAAVLFGLKVPTGRTSAVDRFGELFETEFQPGSGSWDKLLGLAVTQRFGSISLDANVLYVLAGRGAQDTNLGDRFLYNAAISYRVLGAPRVEPPHTHAHTHALSHSAEHHHDSPIHVHDPAPPKPQWAIDLVLEANGEWHDKEATGGVRDANSGGNVVYLSPGLRVSYGSVSGFATIGLPVVNDMNGLQAKASYRAFAGIAMGF